VGQEISLDLDMASAICPNCKIILVEARSASFANLGAAENRAATLGASVISNSFGGSDTSDASQGAPYNHPGIAITVSSGDAGFGVEFPASSHTVTAVGGTHLVRSGTARGWTETVWNGAGSGCSAFNTALTGQASFNTGCARRAVADVSAVADPATGVAVFDSTPSGGCPAARVRRHQRRGTGHRRRVRTGRQPRQHRQQLPLHPFGQCQLQRRDVGQQRFLLAVAAVHRARRLGRADRPGYPARQRRVLIS